MSQKRVYAIPFRDDEEIYFSIKEYKGNQYFDMRIYYQSQDGNTKLPSKKGLTLRLNMLEEFVQGVGALKKASLQMQ